MKMFHYYYEDDIVTGIYEHKTPTPYLEDNLPVHVIPDEGEIVRTNEKNKSSGLTYSKKETDSDTSAYVQLLKAIKN